MNDLASYISERTERPRDFAYFGDLEFSHWASCFGVHRDSDALERSNWQVISEDLTSRYPDDVQPESYNHWAVGWVETLRIRVYGNHPNRLGVPIFSTAIHAAYDWAERLDSYPVADEEHYSQLEWDEFMDYVESESSLWPDSIDRPDDWAYRVSSLMETTRTEDIYYRDLEMAFCEAAADFFHEMNYVNTDQLTLTDERTA